MHIAEKFWKIIQTPLKMRLIKRHQDGRLDGIDAVFARQIFNHRHIITHAVLFGHELHINLIAIRRLIAKLTQTCDDERHLIHTLPCLTPTVLGGQTHHRHRCSDGGKLIITQ